ncbi:MvaI/BcnI restriction endonuclease family protein [Arthrobacter sp. AG367]|uniref:MvaI/BcnI family restriction endonuclease n=1 Tax=Arthrobacter sp. AG367 TaxID=2572909 RepID=UPI0011ACFB20|nr:MvaI/BcnI family restriction endonuclease [Arthrobacter sp. AG367]TWD54053.1 MvaI/BcnI restriction endonuclease family protein [Arthrobacter sp. AG367]
MRRQDVAIGETMRELTELERLNVEFLVRLDVQFGLLEQTKTTLEKAYSDATQEFREFLKASGLHDYTKQGQGQDAKVVHPAMIIDNGEPVQSEVGMYRPVTKSGDPRFRITSIKRICGPGDITAVLCVEHKIYILRLDQFDIDAEMQHSGLLRSILSGAAMNRISASTELLELMLGLAERGFIKTHRTGDTAVGHLLETELGIAANSSKAPDYKGIEIKSTRARAQTRHTMFAKVPDWNQSTVRSTAEFLELYGYQRRGFPELNCEVSARRANSQGLRLRITRDERVLQEYAETPGSTFRLQWELESLRIALRKKHAETFWVKATSERRGDGEYIRFDSVVHTSKPVLNQVVPLLSSGSITVDHLISKKPGKGVKEQGPLFKIADREFYTLFPCIEVYKLG